LVAQILIVMIAAIAVTIFAERRNIQPPCCRADGEMLAARRAAMVKARDERKLDDEVMRQGVRAHGLRGSRDERARVA